MRAGAVLLNFSREGMVDDEAVLKGARERHGCKWYVTDFPERRAARQRRA